MKKLQNKIFSSIEFDESILMLMGRQDQYLCALGGGT